MILSEVIKGQGEYRARGPSSKAPQGIQRFQRISDISKVAELRGFRTRKVTKKYILFTDELANLMVRDAAATLLYMKITSENLKGGNTINILQIIIGIIIVYILIVESPVLLRRVILLWRWHRVKKTGMNFQKYMYDFFSKITLRENEFCRDCKYSEISKNNGNLICLNEKSDNFGAAVAPENEERGFCYFERK